MNRINQYQNVQVMTADGVRLIVMLYEGIIRFNKQACEAITSGDIMARSNSINRSTAIIGELINSLDMDRGGEIAERLLNLYDFSIQQLTVANLKNDPAPIDAVNRVVTELKAGWEAIEKANDGAPKRPEQQRVGISHGA
ncbi:MAG: flagellar export chaperone FliS [Thermodesulfobacteriota bacterium]